MVDSEVIWRVADWFLSSALGALEVIKYQGVGRKRPASIKVGQRKVQPRSEDKKKGDKRHTYIKLKQYQHHHHQREITVNGITKGQDSQWNTLHYNKRRKIHKMKKIQKTEAWSIMNK